MFYDAISNTHGLDRDPFMALVSPRPIGWISTLDANGVVNIFDYYAVKDCMGIPPVGSFPCAIVMTPCGSP